MKQRIAGRDLKSVLALHRRMHTSAVLVLGYHTELFSAAITKGVSHAEWPKLKHEYALAQAGSVISCPLKAVDIKCGAPRDEGLSQLGKRNYERYLALAQAEAKAGDRIAAENYYQHAEHYFRSMSSNPGAT